ncbi:MAG: hypothetical protein HKN87_01415 [Saprospiraceae bacterium]|nr:hypothetical protein [Saprospiraceae bacterium]
MSVSMPAAVKAQRSEVLYGQLARWHVLSVQINQIFALIRREIPAATVGSADLLYPFIHFHPQKISTSTAIFYGTQIPEHQKT